MTVRMLIPTRQHDVTTIRALRYGNVVREVDTHIVAGRTVCLTWETEAGEFAVAQMKALAAHMIPALPVATPQEEAGYLARLAA